MATTLTLEELRKYFHLPIVEVARQLGTCTTALKKICRKHKILKWPYRQIRSLTKSIQSLEMAGLNDSITDELKQQYREQIMTLQKAIDDIVYDPNTNISDLAKKLETEWGNGMNEEKWNGTNEPSENVRQLIQAAAATVSVEGSNSSSRSSHSSNSKRKYAQVEDKMNLGSNENDTSIIVTEVGIPQSSSQSQSSYSYQTQPSTSTSVSKTPAEMVNIGLTQVSHVTLAATDSKNSTIHFVGPVVLAPLERRRISKQASKKLVPLIEPDICNHFKMEFLPQSTILEIKYFRSISLAPNLQGNINTIDMNGGIIDIQQQHHHQHQQQEYQQQEYQQQHYQQQQQQIHAYDPSNIELDMRYNNNININNININNNGNNNMGIVVNDSNGTKYQETE